MENELITGNTYPVREMETYTDASAASAGHHHAKSAASLFRYMIDGLPVSYAEARAFMVGEQRARFASVAWRGAREQYRERFNSAFEQTFLAELADMLPPEAP